MPVPDSRRASGRIQLSLALQGGGAQGAFTWGVLDRLLDEPDIDIVRISGTSAGALNGAALATGLARGGRQGAKDNLALLWQKVAEAGSLLTFLLMPLRKPGMGIWDDAMPLLSPYQVNPMGMAPLRYILNMVADEGLLRGGAGPELYVNAVNVQTGRSRVFAPNEMSIDALLASGCAPLSYQAVQIDGESYWDGSYASNPPLWPLYEGHLDCDILMVELTPQHRIETPMSAKNILNRINEVGSINGLLAELRALDTLNRHVKGAGVRMHVLSLSDRPNAVLGHEPSIKRTVGRVLFEMLRQDGRAACDAWLRENRGLLGKRSTVDIAQRYLDPRGTAAAAAPASAPKRRAGAKQAVTGSGHQQRGVKGSQSGSARTTAR